jgi:hypothetical protein
MEIWKSVTDYEGLYEVSNFGRVRSLNYKRSGEERILTPRASGNGYLTVTLYKNGQRITRTVHSLLEVLQI